MENELLKDVCFAKSFMMLGDSLKNCYNCSYCRVACDKEKQEHYHLLPTQINPNFDKIPVAINLFYGDPMLQIENTVTLLRDLEKANHKGPVIIVTKGDFSKFPDVPFNLDLHIAFSTFGKNSKFDGSSTQLFESNLKQTLSRKNKYRYSIEFRPICYNINDSEEDFRYVLSKAREYGLAVGYSGLQGKKESVREWEKNKIDLHPYPGFEFGHKKIISAQKEQQFRALAKLYDVPVFRKTSCLFSYTHNLERDYNAHYYRPNEVGCYGCPMEKKCLNFKQQLNDVDKSLLPFKFDVIEKQDHVCILKQKGLCNYPTQDCSHISGKIIKIYEKLTTSDVRIIKWLTGMTVDADFYESPYINAAWLSKNEDKK